MGSLLHITLASGFILTEILAATFSGEGLAVSSDGANGSDPTATG